VEVDFFIGQDFLVSTMSEEFLPLQDFFNRTAKNQKDTAKFTTRSPAYLLASLFSVMEKHCHPMLVHVSNDILTIEKEIFAVDKKETIHEMLLIKTNIANYREAADRHPRIINQLSDKLGRFALTTDFEPRLKDVVDKSEDTRALLEDLSRTINALHETHTSLLNFRTNTVMQTLRSLPA
jgi:Mg2+ and Co2+ transporter CorA